MGRKRSEKSYLALEIWRDKQGRVLLKDIAKEIGVSESQIRKWKHNYGWSLEPEEENETNNENEREESNNRTLYMQILQVLTKTIKNDDSSTDDKLKSCEMLFKMMVDPNIGRKINKVERRIDSYSGNSVSEEEWNKCIDYFRNDKGEPCCAYCREATKELQKEHVLPVDKGGKNNSNNIIPACSRCNRTKNNQGLNEWFLKQPFFEMENLNRILKYIE